MLRETDFMGRSGERRDPTLTMIEYNDASSLTFEGLRRMGRMENAPAAPSDCDAP